MARFFCPLQQQNVGRKENTERESNSTLKLCGVLRTQQITKKHQFNFTQTYLNMGCVNTLMLDFEIALNVWTIQMVHLGIHSTPLTFLSFSLCVCVCCVSTCTPQGMTVHPDGDRGLINPADHLLLQANHWRYKGVLCKHT